MLEKYMALSFKDIVNLKDRSTSTAIRMLEGKATENYIFKNIDRSLVKLDIEAWVLYIPWNQRAFDGEKNVHFVVNKDYLSLDDEKTLASTFLSVEEYTKACFIIYDDKTSTIEYKVYDKALSDVSYTNLKDFIEKEYKLDVSKYLNALETKLSAPIVEINKNLDRAITYMEENCDDLTKINFLIYDGLFSWIREELKVAFYQTNLDAIVKEGDKYSIVEVKNKTKREEVIINKAELQVYENLAKKVNVYFYILMSYGELDVKQTLFENGYTYGDAELYYYKVDPIELGLFTISLMNGTECYNIPLSYLKRVNTLLIDSMIENTKSRIPFVMENDKRRTVNYDDYFKYLRVLIASELKKANIISSIFDIKDVATSDRNFFIDIASKRVAIKYVKDLAWRMELSRKEAEDFKKAGVDYVLVVKLAVEGDKAIDIIGYLPLEELIANANICPKQWDITFNKTFWDFRTKSEQERKDEIKKAGDYTYIFSICDKDCNRKGVLPFHKMNSFGKHSIKDFR